MTDSEKVSAFRDVLSRLPSHLERSVWQYYMYWRVKATPIDSAIKITEDKFDELLSVYDDYTFMSR